MSEELFHQDEPLSEVLQQVSSQLRLSLGNIHNALTRLAPPDLRDQRESVDRDAAALCQSYYRILRLTNNLSDASEPERPEGQGMDNDDIVGVCRTVMEQAAAPRRAAGHPPGVPLRQGQPDHRHGQRQGPAAAAEPAVQRL